MLALGEALMLDALAPARDAFLERSLGRLLVPVHQMFPRVEGYTAAVPSKHDVASFVAVVRGELTTISHGEPTLAPLVLHGITKAVQLLASKVDGMVVSGGTATVFGGGGFGADAKAKKEADAKKSGGASSAGALIAEAAGVGAASAPADKAGAGGGASWAPTPEQEHNLQVRSNVRDGSRVLGGVGASTHAAAPPRQALM